MCGGHACAQIAKGSQFPTAQRTARMEYESRAERLRAESFRRPGQRLRRLPDFAIRHCKPQHLGIKCGPVYGDGPRTDATRQCLSTLHRSRPRARNNLSNSVSRLRQRRSQKTCQLSRPDQCYRWFLPRPYFRGLPFPLRFHLRSIP